MRYVLGVFGFIILAIVAIILISTTTGDRTTGRQTGDTQLDVASFADKTATFTNIAQGKIVAQEDFRAIRITVSPSERRIQVLNGYTDTVEREETFANNQNAYDAFVRALDNAGYSRERESIIDDSRGACPTGRRYLYQIHENGNQALNLWSSTCGRNVGNFGGDASQVLAVFQNQIPGYQNYVRGVRL